MDYQPHDSTKKVKRFRSAFTTDQVNYLEKQFKKFPYIGNAHRKEVASALNIPERAVKIWFQNRRMKEKKESVTKEFDDDQNIRKSLEYTKDQLNNVVPSTNEQPRSLPLLTDLNEGNSYKNMSTNNSSSNETRMMVQGVEIKDTAAKIPLPFTQNVVTTAKVIHPPSVFVKTSHLSPEFKSSAEFSIDLCKKYKTECFSNPLCVEQQTLKKEDEDIKKIEEPKFVGFTEQMIPEDLSASRKVNIPAMGPQQSLAGNTSSNSGFVSLVPTVSPFYTQPYISASGVIWKPVSVMPVVSSNTPPVSAPSNPLLNMSPVQENFTKRLCNCDCHVRQVMPQVPYSFPQQSPSPQYIITAMPFQNPSTKF